MVQLDIVAVFVFVSLFFVDKLVLPKCPPEEANDRKDPDRGHSGKNYQVGDHRAAEVRISCYPDFRKSSF